MQSTETLEERVKNNRLPPQILIGNLRFILIREKYLSQDLFSSKKDDSKAYRRYVDVQKSLNDLVERDSAFPLMYGRFSITVDVFKTLNFESLKYVITIPESIIQICPNLTKEIHIDGYKFERLEISINNEKKVIYGNKNISNISQSLNRKVKSRTDDLSNCFYRINSLYEVRNCIDASLLEDDNFRFIIHDLIAHHQPELNSNMNVNASSMNTVSEPISLPLSFTLTLPTQNSFIRLRFVRTEVKKETLFLSDDVSDADSLILKIKRHPLIKNGLNFAKQVCKNKIILKKDGFKENIKLWKERNCIELNYSEIKSNPPAVIPISNINANINQKPNNLGVDKEAEEFLAISKSFTDDTEALKLLFPSKAIETTTPLQKSSTLVSGVTSSFPLFRQPEKLTHVVPVPAQTSSQTQINISNNSAINTNLSEQNNTEELFQQWKKHKSC